MTAVVPADRVAVAEFRHATLPLVALVLGIAAITLGVTVVWYFAVVPVGLAAAVVGIIGLQRADRYDDPRARGRATIGAVLGLVAIVLDVSVAFFLPRVIDRVDDFFTGLQDDVNNNVTEVNNGLRSDVNSFDRTLTRDQRRLEDQNRADLDALERRDRLALTDLENRVTAVDDRTTASARADRERLEASLREDLRAIDSTIRFSDEVFASRVAALEAPFAEIERRIVELERKLGIRE